MHFCDELTMPENFNIYLDESCHLERDSKNVMVLGAISCPKSQVRLVSHRIGEIKLAYGLSKSFEIKWTKASPAKSSFYLDLVNFFFDEPGLQFRGLLIPDKSQLDHKRFNQSHDDWYYKMCFRLLDPIISPENAYEIYLDIKDTRSEAKRAKLERYLRTSNRDGSQTIVRRVQQIRSHESSLMQISDLLIGAIGYHARRETSNQAKLAIIKLIRQRGKLTLDRSTWMGATKFNLFRWSPTEVTE